MRKCIVTLPTKDVHGVTLETREAPGSFYGIFQAAHPFTALLRGEQSGQVAEPVAVVEAEGRLRQVRVDQVRFPDGEQVDDA
jgi:hypothetical protein